MSPIPFWAQTLILIGAAGAIAAMAVFLIWLAGKG